MDKKFAEAIKPISLPVREKLAAIPERIQAEIQEIRIRKNMAMALVKRGQTVFLSNKGTTGIFERGEMCVVSEQQVEETFRAVCGYSLHSHMNDIASGFVTIEGGHRVGICGTAVLENGKITGQKNISSLNVRIAREFKGSADALMSCFRGGLKSVLIVGRPSSGKTTILRDMARQLSNGSLGKYYRVAVVDERGELGAMLRGTPQNDVGLNTDILNCFPKAHGILQALRTLSPDVIICDEVGSSDECMAMLDGLNSGVKFIASAHAADEDELRSRRGIDLLLQNGVFERLAFLKDSGNPSVLERICENEVCRDNNGDNDRVFCRTPDGLQIE